MTSLENLTGNNAAVTSTQNATGNVTGINPNTVSNSNSSNNVSITTSIGNINAGNSTVETSSGHSVTNSTRYFNYETTLHETTAIPNPYDYRRKNATVPSE